MSFVEFFLYGLIMLLSLSQSMAAHEYDGLLPKKCGLIKYNEQNQLSDHVFGGKDSALGQIPWIAVLGFTSDKTKSVKWDFAQCGGSLISDQFVVTAAHCVDTIKPVAVRLGAYNLADPDGEEDRAQVYQIESIEYHETWDKAGTFSDDIALIKLETTVDFTEFIQPICLPVNGHIKDDFEEEEAVVAGWGYTVQGSRPRGASVLQELRLRVWGIDECTDATTKKHTRKQICAGGKKGEDSCNGDSGGPLFWKDPRTSKHYLIGLVSYGSENCAIGEPGIYTRLTEYTGWVLKKMNSMMNE